MKTFVRMVVAIAVLLLGPAASRAIMPRRAFLAAINHACPHCGPYLKVLRQIADNPARIRELFAKRRKIYFPGAKSMAEARSLAAEAVKVEVAWYRFLAAGTKPTAPAFLRSFLSDRRVSGALRSSAAWLLYFETHRAGYAAQALRLHGFEIKIFEHAKDPQFPAILSRLVGGTLAEPAEVLPTSYPTTQELRFDYADFAGSMYFQGVGKSLRRAFFGLYRRLMVPDRHWPYLLHQAQADGLAPARVLMSPDAAPVVVKQLQRFGGPAVLEFLESLAQQGLVADLSQVDRSVPDVRPLVSLAVQRELLGLATKRAALRALLAHPLAASNPLAGKHPPKAFHPAGTPAGVNTKR